MLLAFCKKIMETLLASPQTLMRDRESQLESLHRSHDG